MKAIPNTNDFRAWATIDLGALQSNLSKARDYCPSANIVAVVKANAYGHGALAVAQALRSQLSDDDCFGVASIEEALQLERGGIAETILLLEGVFSVTQLEQAVDHGFQFVVHSLFQLSMLETFLEAHPHIAPLTIWLKIDTGMHRLGFDEQDFTRAWQHLSEHASVEKIIFMSHFACADDLDDEMSERQLQGLMDVLDAADVPTVNREISFAASSGIQLWPQAHFQWLRPGIMLYGGTAVAGEDAVQRGIDPVMTLRAKLISIKMVAAGGSVGYGATYVCAQERRIGVISIGYGDGYPRRMPEGTPVLVNCQASSGPAQYKVPLCGRVSMDMITVDLSDCPAAQVGDEVILWGEGLPADEIARHCNTIAYELFCQVTPRVHFVYK
ncbi:MAG: alanine racemase [Gammaproteobacteria bacterium]